MLFFKGLTLRLYSHIERAFWNGLYCLGMFERIVCSSHLLFEREISAAKDLLFSTVGQSDSVKQSW